MELFLDQAIFSRGVIAIEAVIDPSTNPSLLLASKAIRIALAHCCEILKYSQVYEPYRNIVGQERGRTHRDLNERRKTKSTLNQTNHNLV